MPADLEHVRQKLEEIISSPISGKNVGQLWEQVAEIEKIIGITSMKLLFDGDPDPAIGIEVNCHAYTLGAWKYSNYFSLNNFIEYISGGKFATNGGLFEILIENNIILKTDQPINCNVALYFDSNNRVRHSGIIRNASSDSIIVESKWGVLPVFLHNLYYVPQSYGQPQFYTQVAEDIVARILDAYYDSWRVEIDQLAQGSFRFGRFITLDDLKQDLSEVLGSVGIISH